MRRLLLLFLFVLVIFPVLQAVEYTKQPYRAMLYSAVLPGGGQLYNEAYLKTALVAGLQAFLISLAVSDAGKVNDYQDLMQEHLSDPGLYEQYKSRRDDYKEELRSDYWWIGTVLVLSVADAFVDAHLYNFKQEKQKVLLRFSDRSLQLQYRF
jgi:hypothetical protein